MDGFKIEGSPGLSGIVPGNDTIRDYLSLFNNSLVGLFRCRFSDGAFFLINQGSAEGTGKSMKFDMLMQQTDTKPRQKMKTLNTMGKPFAQDPPQ